MIAYRHIKDATASDDRHNCLEHFHGSGACEIVSDNEITVQVKSGHCDVCGVLLVKEKEIGKGGKKHGFKKI